MSNRYRCPKCGLAAEVLTWPHGCYCGLRHFSAADMLLMKAGNPPINGQSSARSGPGTELLRTVRELGIGDLGCGCKSIAGQMNRWGVEECLRRTQELIRGPLLEVTVRAFNLDPYPIWLDPDHLPESFLYYLCWRAERSKIDWPAPVAIPRPPWISPPLNFSRAVVTVAVGEAGRDMLRISGPLMQAYANRCGADFVVCDWPGTSDWPMSAKYGAWSVLEHYERIAYVDADVILRPGCVNLFDACQPDECGAVSELEHHRNNPRYRIERDYRELRHRIGFPHRPVNFYCNAGVFVCPREYRHLLEPPAELPPYHCAEQDLLNCRLENGLAEGSIKFRLLERRCNWQYWISHTFRDAPPDAILHASGFKNHDERLKLMRRWAALPACVSCGEPATTTCSFPIYPCDKPLCAECTWTDGNPHRHIRL